MVAKGGGYLRVFECSWVSGDILMATWGHSLARRVRGPYVASVVSAERSVEDDVVVRKMSVDVARTLKVGLR